jgi:hypothetical protein
MSLSYRATTEQFDLIKGFFSFIWNAEETRRIKRMEGEEITDEMSLETRQGNLFWAEQLDKAGIPWWLQNKIAELASVRENGFYYIRTLLKGINVEVLPYGVQN